MLKLQDKRLVKYECLIIPETQSKEERTFFEQQMDLTDHFLDNWKKYD